MKKIKFLIIFVVAAIANMSGQKIDTIGEYLSKGGEARVIVSSVGNDLKLKFTIQNKSQRRAKFEVILRPETPWFAYIEGEDSIWIYRGGDTILYCRSIISETESQYVFEKQMLNIYEEIEKLPSEIRGWFIENIN